MEARRACRRWMSQDDRPERKWEMVHNIMRLGWMTLVVALLWSALPASAQAQADDPWIETFGNALNDEATAVARDAAGNAYIVGLFQGAVDFDPGPGQRVLVSSGSRAGFVTKMSPAGDLLWAQRIGGGERAAARGIAVDAVGNSYITGEFGGLVDFDPGPNTVDRESNGDADIFLLKLDPHGNFLWAVTAGSKASDQGEAVVVDANNQVYITGSFEGLVDFDPADGKTLVSSAGEDDIFLVRYTHDGRIVWAKGFGGDDDDAGLNLAVDRTGNVYVTGEFEGNADFDPGDTSTEIRARGDEDVFVAKFAPGGDARWARAFGGLGNDRGPDVAVDNAGDVYVTGGFEQSAAFHPESALAGIVSHGEDDMFLAKLSTHGAEQWVFATGGARTDFGEGIAVDAFGNILVVGSFERNVDFDPGLANVTLLAKGQDDVSIGKYRGDGGLLMARAFGTETDEEARDIAVDARGSPIVVGDLQSGSAEDVALHDVLVARLAAGVWGSATDWINLPLMSR